MTFAVTRTRSITPGSDGGVCGDLIYSFGVQGFNFPPYVLLPNGTYYRLIALGSPDAAWLPGTPGVPTGAPFDPSDPFGPDGLGNPFGPLGMTSGLPGFTPGTPQSGLAAGMVQGLQATGVNVGVVLVTMGTGTLLEGLVDLGTAAEATEGTGGGGGGTGEGGGGGTGGGGGGGGGGTGGGTGTGGGEGTTFYHYSPNDPATFGGSLVPGSYVTNVGDLSGPAARQLLIGGIGPQLNYVATVTMDMSDVAFPVQSISDVGITVVDGEVVPITQYYLPNGSPPGSIVFSGPVAPP